MDQPEGPRRKPQARELAAPVSGSAIEKTSADPSGVTAAPTGSAPTGSRVTASSEASKDLVYVHSPTEKGFQIVRFRDEKVESGELRPIREGEPIVGELVKLTPRAEHQQLFSAEVIARSSFAPKPRPTDDVQPESGARGHHGPARVSTEAYRSNWDQIFGKGRPSDLN